LPIDDRPVGTDPMSTSFSRYFENSTLLVAAASEGDFEDLVGLLRRVGERCGKVLLAGNGGSAEMVDHAQLRRDS